MIEITALLPGIWTVSLFLFFVVLFTREIRDL